MERIATWGQQANESEPAYAAFKVYRDAGIKRSLRKAASEVGKARTLIERWSSRHQWGKRVATWDLEQQDLRRDARVVAIGDAEARHGKLARAVLGRVAAELGANHKGRCQTCGRGAEPLTPQQVAAWLRVGVDVERTGLGLGSSSAPAASVVNVSTTVVAGGQTNLVLLRDQRSQRLASELLSRMRSLDPATSLRRLGKRGPEVVDVLAAPVTGRAAIAARKAEALEAREPATATLELPTAGEELGGFDEGDDEGDLF